MTPDLNKWYVLITRPRAEKQVSRRLTETGFENYLPLRRHLRIWNDRKKWVEEPLFSSYIFVKTEDRLRSRVFEAGGLVKYLSIGSQIATLSEEEIERVKRLCSYEGEIEVREGELTAGDLIVVTQGHFAGLHGSILKIEGQNKLKLALNGLGCFASVEIDGEWVRKIN